MAKDNELVIKINGNVKGYKKALKAATKETEDLQFIVNKIAKTGAIAFAGFGAAILFAAKSAGKFETIETQFEVLTSSVEEAQEAMQNLSDFAAETPFQFEEVANAGKQLLAFKVIADQIPNTLQKLGDVAAAVGTPLKDLTLIFGQVKAAGKLTGERLLQLEERAVPIGPALAKTMGVAETSIRDLVSKGEVSFKTFEKAFASLSEKGGLAFEGMAKRSKTLEGQLSTLSDNFDLVVAAIGKNFIPTLKELTGSLINVLEFIRENPGLTDFIAKMLVAGTVTGALLTTVALGATIFLKLRASMVAAAVATKGLKFAIKGLIGSTGLGLLIAFLPDIIEAFKSAFGEATNIVEKETELQARAIKDQKKILKAERDGMSAIDLIYFKNRLDRTRAFDKASLEAEKNRGDKTIGEFRKQRDAEFDLIKFQFDKRLKAELANVKETANVKKTAFDKKTQQLIDENELLEKHLEGIESEELGFAKRRQAIKEKERTNEAIQDKTRKDLAIQNVKLLNDQLIKEEEELAIKRVKIQQDIDDKALDQIVKDQEQAEQKIQILKNQNEFISAGLKEQEDEEVGFLKRRQEIRDEKRDAESLAAGEEKDLILANNKLKNDQLLIDETEFDTRKKELKAEQTEAETALEEELAALSTEKRKALQQAEMDDLTKNFESKEKIRSKAVKQELLNKRKEDALFQEEEEKHGTIIANFRAFNRSSEFGNAQTAAAALSQLQRSENDGLKAIGKAAALVQIGINTQKGAIAAYSALAGIPIVGPGLGIAAASALTIFGLERAAQVTAAQTGGVVGGTGFGDRVPFLLEPGELITPRQNFEEVINSVAEQRIGRKEAEDAEIEEPIPQEISIGFDGEEAADVLTVKQNEQNFLGTSQAI